MLIDNIFLESDKTNIKLSARVKWEDVDRPTQNVFFQLSTGSSAPFREPLLSADPFVVGGLVPAIRHGEQRIKAEGPISPWLTDNLATLESYLIQELHAFSPVESILFIHYGEICSLCRVQTPARLKISFLSMVLIWVAL